MKFTVFGKLGCIWCDRATELLSSKDIDFKYVDIKQDLAAHQFITNAGHTTLPQVYKDNGDTQEYVGGYVELHKLFVEVNKPVLTFASLGIMEEEPEIPLVSLADEPTKEARVLAENEFNPLWVSQGMIRDEAYAWLADAMGIPKEECHIDMFNMEQCLDVVKLVQQYKEALE